MLTIQATCTTAETADRLRQAAAAPQSSSKDGVSMSERSAPDIITLETAANVLECGNPLNALFGAQSQVLPGPVRGTFYSPRNTRTRGDINCGGNR